MKFQQNTSLLNIININIINHFVNTLGFEPKTPTLKVLCSTCWAMCSNSYRYYRSNCNLKFDLMPKKTNNKYYHSSCCLTSWKINTYTKYFISTPNENRTRVTRMKILGTNHYTMGAFNSYNSRRLATIIITIYIINQ